jgi:uncharacterized hydrophobic protein (TIGR00271 family)
MKRLLNPIRPLSAERRTEVLNELAQTSSPGFDYFLLVVLSCSIATFGLITNSVAVIIGAMLVAPLMSPILGLSIASVAGDRQLFERAAIALFRGVILAIALSAALSWVAQILPFDALKEIPTEVLSRTHPSPYDLVIALAGGAAAAYALAQPQLSAALPGVAIATALMPPLCTVGIGISQGNPRIDLGALLLFLTNFAAISFAGIGTFALLGFRPKDIETTWHGLPRSLLVSAVLVMLITFPLVALTLSSVNQANFSREIRSTITTEVGKIPGVQLVDVATEGEDSTLRLQVTVRASRQISYIETVALQSAIVEKLQRTISLQLIVVPMIKLDPLVPPTPTYTPLPGATATFTPSPTSTLTPISSATLMPTPTTTSTSTDTATPTSTFTPTPVLAYIANTGRLGIYLRDKPNGKIIGSLPEGSAVQILYRREFENKIEWMEVRDLFNRTGWIPVQFLVIKP